MAFSCLKRNTQILLYCNIEENREREIFFFLDVGIRNNSKIVWGFFFLYLFH